MTEQPFEGLLGDFLMESQERATRVEEILLALARAPKGECPGLLDEARRELHTLKGNAGMMGFRELQTQAHRMEDEVGALDAESPETGALLASLDRLRSLLAKKSSPAAAPETEPADGRGPDESEPALGSVRVPFSALDELMDLLAEMVIFRNRLGDAIFRGHREDPTRRAWEDVKAAQEALKKTLGFIQDRFMQLRMVALQTLFVRLRRIVHDEALREAKRVRLETSGGDVVMDKALLDVTREALGHLVRNAVVHGIESPEARAAAGKPPEGTIRLKALARSGEVWVDVEDDGAGVDREALAAIAMARGLPVSSNEDLYQVLFAPGFTTRESADMSSGRGMGLSAAAEAVQRLGGRIEVASEPGAGSLFRIKMPLSVSITRAMIVKVDGEEYALPLASITESVRLLPGDGHMLNHAGVIRWRGRVVPIVDLGHFSGTAQGIRDRGYAILIEADGKPRGLVVDDLTGIKEIVVKGLGPMVGTPEGVSGATIVGDGRVLLILDPRSLANAQPFVTGGGRGHGPAAPSRKENPA